MYEWQQEPLRTCCCQCFAPISSSRRSRIDDYCGRDTTYSEFPQSSQVTLFRTHSVRRIGAPDTGCTPAPPPDTTTVCCQTCTIGDSGIYLSSPFILKDVRSRHRSPLRSHRSPSNRNVRFCGPERSGDNIRATSPRSSSERRNACPSPSSRASSLVRVYSRSSSPMCETILTASLPSKSAGNASVSCECNIPPACAPKPRGNFKYSYMLKPCVSSNTKDFSCSCNFCNCVSCFDIKIPPTPVLDPPIVITSRPCEVKTTIDCCTNTEPQNEVADRCEAPICEPPPKPCGSDSCCQTSPKIERYETTSCRVERITTRRRRGLPTRSFSCARAGPNASYYLRLVDRAENDLWNRISECEMDLAAFDCMMNCDVINYIKDAICKSRHLIDCEFRRIRRVCDPVVMPSCYDEGRCERNDKNIEELWRETQCKINEVSHIMDKIDRLRSNGWKW
ncbi:hypothetical protein Aperf_G00000100620 [Anoplocephala perfoliata]